MKAGRKEIVGLVLQLFLLIVMMETVSDFIFLGSKITADGDCSHEIKRSLILGRKKCVKKQRHHFADKRSI